MRMYAENELFGVLSFITFSNWGCKSSFNWNKANKFNCWLQKKIKYSLQNQAIETFSTKSVSLIILPLQYVDKQ